MIEKKGARFKLLEVIEKKVTHFKDNGNCRNDSETTLFEQNPRKKKQTQTTHNIYVHNINCQQSPQWQLMFPHIPKSEDKPHSQYWELGNIAIQLQQIAVHQILLVKRLTKIVWFMMSGNSIPRLVNNSMLGLVDLSLFWSGWPHWFLHVMLFCHVKHVLAKLLVPPVADNQDDDHSNISEEEND